MSIFDVAVIGAGYGGGRGTRTHEAVDSGFNVAVMVDEDLGR